MVPFHIMDSYIPLSVYLQHQKQKDEMEKRENQQKLQQEYLIEMKERKQLKFHQTIISRIC